MVVVFVAKLEKVRFVLKRSEEDRMGPWVSNENRVLVTRAATYAQAPAPLLHLTLPRVCGDACDIHRCRSTLPNTGHLARVALQFNQPLGKTQKSG